MQKRVLDKMVDTSDAPWKTTMKDIGTSPIPPQNPSTYTQTSTLQVYPLPLQVRQ